MHKLCTGIVQVVHGLSTGLSTNVDNDSKKSSTILLFLHGTVDGETFHRYNDLGIFNQ